LLSSSKHSGVPEDSQPPTFPSVGLHPHTWPKWGCDNYSHMGMKKSNYKEILNMKYLCKGIKPLFMVIYLMKLNALSISNNLQMKKG